MFVGCSNYPACHHIESINQPEPEKQSQEHHACPECGKGHLVERKTRFGKTFYACDNYPKCKFAVNLRLRGDAKNVVLFCWWRRNSPVV